jgi:hypothetical protein
MRSRFAYVSLVAAIAAATIASTATAVRADTTIANWAQQSPSQSPAGRAYPSMAYDSRRGRTVLFGGGVGCCNEPNDTWEWDGSHWSTFFTTIAPPGSIGAGMAYDSARAVTVLFDNHGQTWEWNGSDWVQRSTTTSPPARVWTSMAYDAARGRIVLFGGTVSGTEFGDTWTYDGTNWTKMAPAGAPSSRFGTAMAFDSARGVVVLFGGRANGQRMNDIWEWDGTTWTQRAPAAQPLPRFWHSMAYDAQVGAMVMYGGDHIEPFGLGPIDDTWLWDGTNWTRDWTAAVPIYRAGQAMAYDAARARITLFGGTDELNPGVYYGDTWEFGDGIVTPAGNPALVPPAISVSFGSHGIGTTTAPAHFRFFGGGSGPLLISSISTIGDFAVSSTDCPIAPNPLAVNAFCNIYITYTPTVCGTRIGSLVFADNSASGTEAMQLEGGVLSPDCDGDLELIAQSDIAVNATSPSGATIDYNRIFTVDEEATPPPITCDPALNSTFPIGTTTVTCSVTDSDDVTSTVTAAFHVTVRDTDLGLSGVPADIKVDAASPSGTVVTYAAPTVVDEDANAAPVNCSPASGSTFPIGTSTVSCSVTDADDTPSSATATFKVIVGDGDLALAGVPADVTVQATSASGAAVGYVAPTAVDEDAVKPTATCDHGSGSLFPLGTTIVTCQTTDSDDTPSTVTATFQVTVIDTDLGLSFVPADITVNATGPAGAAVSYAPPTGADEDGAAVPVTCDRAPGSIFPIGTTTVTCSVSDSDDTPSTRSAAFRVTVNDTDLALAATPSDITAIATSSAGAVVTYRLPTAVDEESLPVSCSPATGSTFTVGTTIVTCQVNDSDDTPANVSTHFNVNVIPDVQEAVSVTPTSATVHTTVTTRSSVKNIGAVSRKVTFSYSITYVNSFGGTTVVATGKAVATIAPGQTATRSFTFRVKRGAPTGTYLAIVTATDETGFDSEAGTFTVT